MKKKRKRNLGDNRVVHLSLKTSVLLSTISDKIPGSPGTESSNGHYMHHTISRAILITNAQQSDGATGGGGE